MAANSNYALRVPSSLMDDIRDAANADGVSMNGFIVQAAAEKVAALRARGVLRAFSAAEQSSYLDARAARASSTMLRNVLAKAGTKGEILPGDELPENWLEGAAPDAEPAARRGGRGR